MAERRASKPAPKPASKNRVRTKRAARYSSRVEGLTHLDARGRARMVDVGEKATTQREAVARGRVRMQADTLRVLASGQREEGDVLRRSRASPASRRPSARPSWIPLCHGIALTGCELHFELRMSRPASCISRHVRERTIAPVSRWKP